MIHWKVKLVSLAVFAASITAAIGFLSQPFGCSW